MSTTGSSHLIIKTQYISFLPIDSITFTQDVRKTFVPIMASLNRNTPLKR